MKNQPLLYETTNQR